MEEKAPDALEMAEKKTQKREKKTKIAQRALRISLRYAALLQYNNLYKNLSS